jgi:hypothetical protein
MWCIQVHISKAKHKLKRFACCRPDWVWITPEFQEITIISNEPTDQTKTHLHKTAAFWPKTRKRNQVKGWAFGWQSYQGSIIGYTSLLRRLFQNHWATFSVLWRYVNPQNDHVTLRPERSSPMGRHRAPPKRGSWLPEAAWAVDSASLLHGPLRVNRNTETEKKVNGWWKVGGRNIKAHFFNIFLSALYTVQ